MVRRDIADRDVTGNYLPGMDSLISEYWYWGYEDRDRIRTEGVFRSHLSL